MRVSRASPTPATTGPTLMGTRGPMRCDRRPARDDSTSITRVIGIRAVPAAIGLYPATCCSWIGSRNSAAPERRVDDEGHRVRRGELPGAEEVERQDGVARARLHDDEGDQGDHPGDRHQRARRAPAHCGPSVRAYVDPRQAQRGQRRAEGVEAAGAPSGPGSRARARRPQTTTAASGRLIRKMSRHDTAVHQPAAEERADRRRHAAEPDQAPIAAPAVVGVEGRLDDRQAARREQGAAHPLERPRAIRASMSARPRTAARRPRTRSRRHEDAPPAEWSPSDPPSSSSPASVSV